MTFPSIRSIAAAAMTMAFLLSMGGAAIAQHHMPHQELALKQDPRTASSQMAPLLSGLGNHHHKVTTSSDRAQEFFDQGLKLAYGFNHQEALRSFKEAARLDPDCAMAYWGWAFVLGPNLNLAMSPEAANQAYEAIQMAMARKDKASAPERDYIEALAKRYSHHAKADQAALNAAYSDAMGQIHAKYPEDLDAATLYADSLMNLSPWNYWTRDGQPRKNTTHILSLLENVMQRDPEHEGALHYYIHAVEALDPDRGLAAADRLWRLTPGAGHLVHMPSHLYMQTGRYAEAYELNGRAARADENYITQCRTQGIYPLGYYPHNVHFQAWAALMQGNRSAAIAAARKVASKVPVDMRENHWALYQTFTSMPLFALVRFGQWDAILAEPAPPEKMKYATGIFHYARGLAYTHTGGLISADRELKALSALSQNPKTAEEPIGFSNGQTLLTIAREVLSGELAAKQKDYPSAISHLERAVRLEDGLHYNEPPDWYFPVRHMLGAVLLEAGFPAEAEIVYWQDLKKYRENGYSLYGLWQSLKARGQTDESTQLETRFRNAWAGSDVMLSSSRF